MALVRRTRAVRKMAFARCVRFASARIDAGQHHCLPIGLELQRGGFAPMQFTISARGKESRQPIQQFIKIHFPEVPPGQIESFFGFAEACTLYGGRFFTHPEISRYDLR
ncbi:MAG: hypothetical protein KBG75_12625, partial [Pseudomonadales bacterium]|nr:hypothetical protein [Pseudomonadales bacterium]